MKQLLTSLLCAVSLAALCCAPLRAERRFVSSAQELKAVLSELAPGDEIVWRNGSYDAQKIRLSANGTEKRPVVLRAETPGGVVLTGASSLTLDGTWLVAEGFAFRGLDSSMKGSQLSCAKGSSDCRISGCLIDGGDSVQSEVDNKWVSLYGQRNEVSHCTFLDKRNMGALLVVWMEKDVVPAHRILNNYFTRPLTIRDEKGRSRNGQEAIRIGTSTFSLGDGKCLVEGNYFYECHGERAEIVSNKSCGNVYVGNAIESSAGSFTLRHGNACTVRGNYIRSDGRKDQGGIRLCGERHVVEGNVLLNIHGDGYKSAICIMKGEENPALSGYFPVRGLTLKGNLLIDCPCGIEENVSGRASQVVPAEGVKMKGNRILSADSALEAKAGRAMEEIRKNAGIQWK